MRNRRARGLWSRLPGLFSATAQGAHVATIEPDRATNVLANCLLSVAQKVACDPTNDTTDKKLQADLRYRAAVAQAITVSLGLTEQSRRHASDRCAFLAKHRRAEREILDAPRRAGPAPAINEAAWLTVSPLLRQGEITPVQAAERLGVSRATVYRRLRDSGG